MCKNAEWLFLKLDKKCDEVLTTAKHISLLKSYHQRQIGSVEPTCAFPLKVSVHSFSCF